MPLSPRSAASPPHQRGDLTPPPASPESDYDYSDADSPSETTENDLQQDLARLGIHGAPNPSQFEQLVEAAAKHPELEEHIQEVASDLALLLSTPRSLEERLRPLWLAHREQNPAAARVIEHILNAAIHAEQEEDEGVEMLDLDGDVRALGAPLGQQIRAWLGKGTQLFDDEPQAPAFARMLERLREEALPGLPPTAATRMRTQIRDAVLAMARNIDLRGEIFLVAQTALGDCRDNLLEGFSKVMLAVRKHEVAQAVRQGRMNEAQLNAWAGQEFRLSILETAVTRFIDQQKVDPDLPPWRQAWLEKDPMETLVHAKAALREALDLPPDTTPLQTDIDNDETPDQPPDTEQRLTGIDNSVLEKDTIAALQAEVLAEAADPQAYRNFLLKHETWRTGIQELHGKTFKKLEEDRDNHEFHDEAPPDDLESPAAFAYAAKANEIYTAWQSAVQDRLRILADGATGALPPSSSLPPPDILEDPGPSQRA